MYHPIEIIVNALDALGWLLFSKQTHPKGNKIVIELETKPTSSELHSANQMELEFKRYKDQSSKLKITLIRINTLNDATAELWIDQSKIAEFSLTDGRQYFDYITKQPEENTKIKNTVEIRVGQDIIYREEFSRD